MKKKIIFISIICFILDYITKYFSLKNNINITIIPKFLKFINTRNEGIAFSMFSGSRLIIIIISLILIFILISMLKKDYLNKNINNNIIGISYGLLFGGILGNLFDRIIRGYVIDFISFNIFGYKFPIFNIADICITFGIIFLIYYTIKEDKTTEK